MKHFATALTALVLSLAAVAICAAPRSVRTTRTPLKINASRTPAAGRAALPAVDTIAAMPEAVKVSGYDKPLGASHETAFITNRSGRNIEAISVTLNYSDLSGRQLHSVRRTIRCDVPHGETRQARWRSWDVNRSFYYRLSRRPRTSGFTPYDVTCLVDTLFVSPLPATDNR